MALTLEQFGIDKLSTAERRELLNLISDSIPEDDPIAMSDQQLKVIDERLEEVKRNPGQGDPWNVVKKRLDSLS